MLHRHVPFGPSKRQSCGGGVPRPCMVSRCFYFLARRLKVEVQVPFADVQLSGVMLALQPASLGLVLFCPPPLPSPPLLLSAI